MVKVNVNNTTWSIPERITVDEWVALQKWDFANETHWPYIINDLLYIPLEDLQAAQEDSLQLFIGFLIAAVNKRTLKHQVDFNELKFGEFVDLDCYMAMGVEKNIHNMLEILKVETPWANEALAVIEQFIKWRNTVYKRYKALFGLEDKDFVEAPEPDEMFSPKEVSRGWYNVIVDLAQEDVLKMDLITEEPLEKILTFLQIKKEKALAAAQEARAIKNRQR